MSTKLLHLVSAALLISLSGEAAATLEYRHPGASYPRGRVIDASYFEDSPMAHLSSGDMTFSTGKTPFAELSPAERYMLLGSSESDLPQRQALDPWVSQTMRMVMAYYQVYQSVPSVLDEAAIRSIPYYQDWPQEQLEVLRNPLTGAWPRLDATEHSPGDMYVRPLTQEEVRDIAVRTGQEASWLEAESGVPGAGRGPLKLLGRVFYQRVYGLSGPIYESLPHACGKR